MKKKEEIIIIVRIRIIIVMNRNIRHFTFRMVHADQLVSVPQFS